MYIYIRKDICARRFREPNYLLTMHINMTIIMTMNIYVTKENEEWLRIQDSSMSGIINKFLDEARSGRRGLHVLASYDTLEEAVRSDLVVPNLRIDATKGTAVTTIIPPPTPVSKPKEEPKFPPSAASMLGKS